MTRHDDLERIEAGLDAALKALAPFTSGEIATEFKSGNDPITAADLAVDEALAELLPREGEGWLSEETVDDRTRLSRNRVWIVDPIDGTREFVQGIPEWCVSIGLLEAGRPVAGGIVNPATGERIIGSVETGLRTAEIVEVTRGLEPNDRVIVTAIQRLRPGLPVEIQAETP